MVSLPSNIGGFSDNDMIAIIFFVAIIAIAMWFLGQEKEEKKPEESGQQRVRVR